MRVQCLVVNIMAKIRTDGSAAQLLKTFCLAGDGLVSKPLTLCYKKERNKKYIKNIITYGISPISLFIFLTFVNLAAAEVGAF